MRRTHVFAGIAAGLFVALFTMEQLSSKEKFDLVGFSLDVVEMALLVGAVATTAFVSTQTRDMRLERLELVEDLAHAQRESAHWREAARVHVAGLGQAIAAQFRLWGLTEAEADVAGMMLKGLAHKEIAALRSCSEATVRQHATTVYRKSGLSSRSQLTAFFLEDLLPSTADPVKLAVVPQAR